MHTGVGWGVMGDGEPGWGGAWLDVGEERDGTGRSATGLGRTERCGAERDRVGGGSGKLRLQPLPLLIL